MPFLLIPNEVKTTEAVIWAGIVNEPDDTVVLSLFCNGLETPIPPSWSTYATRSGANTIRYMYFTVNQLEPGTKYIFQLFRGDELLTTCATRTLPTELPFAGEKAFTVLLTSCFCASNPESKAIGNTLFFLSDQDKPDIKILSGDQVYLDSPWQNFIASRHDFNELEDIHFTNYLNTWNHAGNPFGNSYFLQDGANFFSADDHELWNNAPNNASAVWDTHFSEGRRDWQRIAVKLLEVFQNIKKAGPPDTNPRDLGKATIEFAVDPLRFFIADTRVNRDPGTGDFMTPEHMGELERWVNDLSMAGSDAAGVVVIGQPLFTKGASWFESTFVDKSLANYDQYKKLAEVLSATARPIVILTGDVHYARLAQCKLSGEVSLYEVISSPSALVDKKAGEKWEKAPVNFPASSIGIVPTSVNTRMSFDRWQNHFLTLGFYRDGGGINVIIKFIEITNNGTTPNPIVLEPFRIGGDI